jgi:hypothetical protein
MTRSGRAGRMPADLPAPAPPPGPRADELVRARGQGLKTVRMTELMGVRSGLPHETPFVESRLYW